MISSRRPGLKQRGLGTDLEAVEQEEDMPLVVVHQGAEFCRTPPGPAETLLLHYLTQSLPRGSPQVQLKHQLEPAGEKFQTLSPFHTSSNTNLNLLGRNSRLKALFTPAQTPPG